MRASSTELVEEVTIETIDLSAAGKAPGKAAAIQVEGEVEVDDICAVDPLLRTGSHEIPMDAVESSVIEVTEGDLDDSVEIELSAEQIDSMISDK
jgi:hypothetical protein